MSTKAAVHTSVLNALAHDGKFYDANQIMNAAPYGYATPDLMRDFLLDVSHELATDVPPFSLDVGKLDLNACMLASENKLESLICAVLPQIS